MKIDNPGFWASMKEAALSQDTAANAIIFAAMAAGNPHAQRVGKELNLQMGPTGDLPGMGEARYSGIPFGFDPKGVATNLGDLYHRVRDLFSTRTLPKTTRSSAEAANALASHASVSEAVTPEARNLMSQIMPERYKDSDFTGKVMDLLNKNDILGGYDQRRTMAADERAKGNDEAADRLDKQADDILGAHDIEAMDKEVKAGIADPEIKKAFENWRDIYGKQSEDYYKKLKALDPDQDLDLDSRGRYLGTRVNLKAITEEKPAGETPIPAGGSGNLRNPSVKRDQFDRMAKLTGTYDTDMQAVLENALGRRMNETTKLDAYDALQKAGLAKLRDPGDRTGVPDDWRAIQGANVPGPGGSRQAKDLFVRPDIHGEVYRALNIGMRENANPIARAITWLNMKGLIDPAIHTRNLLSAVSNSQGGKTVLGDVARRFPGVNMEEALRSIAVKHSEVVADSPQIRASIAEMAKNAMLRSHATGEQTPGIASRFIHGFDEASRLVMNDRFNELVKRGLKTDTMENRREFVNQAGQYNRRLSGRVMQIMKDWGVAPFVVAGRNFNRQAVGALTGGSPGESPTRTAALQHRLTNIVATVGSAAAVAATTNYLRTGSMAGRKGVPLGAIDLGTNDDKGNPKYLDLFQSNLVRRGLMVTGAGPVLEGMMSGAAPGQYIAKGLESAANSQIHPWTGPAAKFASMATTGANPSLPLHQVVRDNQVERNATGNKEQVSKLGTYAKRTVEAVRQTNPLVAAAMDTVMNRMVPSADSSQQKQTIGEALQKQIESIAGIKSAYQPPEPKTPKTPKHPPSALQLIKRGK
jgi:hypothetical protein